MKLLTVKLESIKANEGLVIGSDVHDSLGRLLLKAPRPLDEHTKNLLFSRGVREIIIQDRRELPRTKDLEAINLEIKLLERRLALFNKDPGSSDFKELVQQTVLEFYKGKDLDANP